MKSFIGCVITLGSWPFCQCSKFLTEIGFFTLEAQCIVLAQVMRELIPMHHWFEAMVTFFNLLGPDLISVKSTIWEDNNGCISTCCAPKLTPRTRHIAVKYHFVRNFFGPDGFTDHPYQLEKIDTKDQKADIFTKGLNADAFQALRQLLCGW